MPRYPARRRLIFTFSRILVLLAFLVMLPIRLPAQEPPDPTDEELLAGKPVTVQTIKRARHTIEEIDRSVVLGVEDLVREFAPEPVERAAFSRVVKDLTMLRVAMSLLVILSIVIARFVADGFFRRLLVRYPGNPPRSVPGILLKALHRPLILVLWSYGLYVGTAPLLAPFYNAAGDAYLLDWTRTIADLIALWALCGFTYRLVNLTYARISGWAAGSENRFERIVIPLIARVVRVLVPLVAILLTVPILDIPLDYKHLVGKVVTLLVIGVVTWMLLEIATACESLLLAGHRLDEADNLQARRIYTQVHVLKKVVMAAILVLGIASMLMIFPSVRQFGGSILASAGIAGIILGIAAQRSLSNIIAGFQIAITQPLRIEDAVIVEGEWGWVEEITLTYVVVRIWDWRRLVLPITYFVEKPFQNWTRTSGNILGSVFLYVDYTLPLEPLRAKLNEILDATPLWDRQAKVLQVTDSREHVIELRILCSGKDSPTTWDLRCHVREELIKFIRDEYPGSLPRLRAELDRVPFDGERLTPFDAAPPVR